MKNNKSVEISRILLYYVLFFVKKLIILYKNFLLILYYFCFSFFIFLCILILTYKIRYIYFIIFKSIFNRVHISNVIKLGMILGNNNNILSSFFTFLC